MSRSFKQFPKPSPIKQVAINKRVAAKTIANNITSNRQTKQPLKTPVKQQADDGFDMFEKRTPLRNDV